MKKILIIGLILILGVLLGCSNSDIYQTEPTTITQVITTTVSLEDVSMSFPEEFIVRTGVDDLHNLPFERQYRANFYRILGSYLDLAPEEQYDEWVHKELWGNIGVERIEPALFSFIKYFDITFDEFKREVIAEYLFRRERNHNIANEETEIPNPYLLFTFNLERINDYYSLDPARHTSARLWLEEWLQTNEPYESYSAFRAANSQ